MAEVGVVYDTIVRALAAQVAAGVDRQTNVKPYPDGSWNPPQITVHTDPSPTFDYWGTFGPNGLATLFLRLKIEVAAVDIESVCIKVADYLSVGTGNNSSVIDAVHADRSLGGVVGENACAALTAEWDTDTAPGVAWVPVQILLTKQNAEVA